MSTDGSTRKLRGFGRHPAADNAAIHAKREEARSESQRFTVAADYPGAEDGESRAVADFMRKGQCPPYALLAAWARKATTAPEA